MRILFVLNDAGGGASMSAYQLMTVLRARGVRPYVVCYPSGSKHDLDRFRSVCEGVQSVYMPRLTYPSREPFLVAPFIVAKRTAHSGFHCIPVARIARLIRRWCIDVVHTNTSTQVDGALAAKVAGVGHVWHVREMIGTPYSFRFYLPRRVVVSMIYQLSDRVIANSYTTASRLRVGRAQQRLTVIHNGVNVGEFGTSRAAQDGQDLRAKWEIPVGALVVGMVGAVGAPVKGHRRFLDMAAAIEARQPDTYFVICGSIPASHEGKYGYYRELVSRAEACGIADRLRFVGHVTDIPAMMAALDVLVHPGEGETFGRVVIEAMATGTPVVRFDPGIAVEVSVPNGSGILVPMGRTDILSERVIDLLTAPVVRAQLGKLQREEAARNFSIGVQANRVAATYDAVLCGRKR